MNIKSDFIQAMKLVIEVTMHYKKFGLCHVFHTRHGVIQQSNMPAGVIQVCLQTVSWVK